MWQMSILSHVHFKYPKIKRNTPTSVLEYHIIKINTEKLKDNVMDGSCLEVKESES